MPHEQTADQFRPFVVRADGTLTNRLLFHLRRCADLQLHTIVRAISLSLKRMRGRVLDVGCGEMPFRHMLRDDVDYRGIDVVQSSEFGMAPKQDVTPFDGIDIPFADASMDNIICTEVLEHAVDPVALIREMHRVLKPGGTLVATVPFSARVHYRPYDFHRFTSHRLETMFAGFDTARIAPRGNDICVISNKLTVLLARILSSPVRAIMMTPLILLLAPLVLAFIAMAHVSLWIGAGSQDDPLGYVIEARR